MRKTIAAEFINRSARRVDITPMTEKQFIEWTMAVANITDPTVANGEEVTIPGHAVLSALAYLTQTSVFAESE